MEAILIDTKTLEKVLGVSKKTAVKIGDKADARFMAGTALRWKVKRIEEYIDSVGGINEKSTERI